MILNNIESSRDEKNIYYGNMQVVIEDSKEEIEYSQTVFNLQHEVTVVSKAALPVLKKYGQDIIEMVKSKYPEDVISTDFNEFVEFVEAINAK
ncbi:MAG: hypothetical protein DRH57_05475 [Candidatus Cloacimonadota bacterium]|nr:MAG: hypothetical protein DRH57_05475 [Candidatus Cloacimonadota bacterium]